MTAPPTARSAFTRPGFLISAAVVALIVLTGLVVVLLPGRDEPGRRTAEAAPRAPGADPPAEPATLPTAVPTTAPPDVTWQLLGQVALPFSDSAGPRETDRTASGYARTPTGALVAAAQLGSRSGQAAGRDVWEPTITGQFVPGADRDTLLAGLRALPDTPPEPGELSQLAGFQYLSYTPETAVVGLVYRAPGGRTTRFFIATLTLRWLGGDWKMVAPPAGSWSSLRRQASDLTGVVEWGPR